MTTAEERFDSEDVEANPEVATDGFVYPDTSAAVVEVNGATAREAGPSEPMLHAGELRGAASVGGASAVGLPRGSFAEHTGPLDAAPLDDDSGVAREIEADTSVRLLSEDVAEPTDPGQLPSRRQARAAGAQYQAGAPATVVAPAATVAAAIPAAVAGTTAPLLESVVSDDAPAVGERKLTRLEKRAIATKGALSSPWASAIAVILAILWTIPSLGLLVSSFRDPVSIRRSGWWNVITDVFSGQGVLTLDNYNAALFGDVDLYSGFINSFVITIPAVVIPITIALLAAYAFAWVEFPGRNILFVAVFALQVVPLQVALVPLMSDFLNPLPFVGSIQGSYWAVWFSHSIFALPLAIFLLHNFMKEIPPSLIEAARVDGAGHVKIFFRVLMPLLVPAIASFGIFQFLWVWNDLLVGLTFANPAYRPLTVAVAELVGSRGGQWHLLTAGAFISMIVPLVVFLSLQRFFVRGLLAGSVKG